MKRQSDTEALTTLRERLQAKYPSMSEAALRSAMMAAISTMEGRTPNTTRTTSYSEKGANKRRAKDARKGNR